MATIIKLKRPLDEEPINALVLSSKRRKTNNSDSCTVLERVATLEKEDQPVEPYIEKALKENQLVLGKSVKELTKSSKSIIEKNRSAVKASSFANRFKVKCLNRGIPLNLATDNSPGDEKPPINSFEIVEVDRIPKDDVITCNGVPLETEKVEYVYDLYMTTSPVQHSVWTEDLLEIFPIEEITNLGTSIYCNETSDEDNDESDENSESNWRNDYPDEEDYDEEESEEFLESGDFLSEEMRRVKLNYDTDESYDDFEEEYKHEATDSFHSKHMKGPSLKYDVESSTDSDDE